MAVESKANRSCNHRTTNVAHTWKTKRAGPHRQNLDETQIVRYNHTRSRPIQAVPEPRYAFAPPLQVDNIFVFIRQVAPVPACWLFKTSATTLDVRQTDVRQKHRLMGAPYGGEGIIHTKFTMHKNKFVPLNAYNTLIHPGPMKWMGQ